MMLLLFIIIFVVVVFNLSRVTLWCLERLWLCVRVVWPSGVCGFNVVLVVVKVVLVVVIVATCCCCDGVGYGDPFGGLDYG